MGDYHNKKLLSAITEYVLDSRHDQAILVDGDWGTGKTFFIAYEVIPTLQKLNKGEDIKQRVIYLSLYGITSSQQILNELCSLVTAEKVREKFGDSKGDKINKGTNFFSKILPVATSIFNIDVEKFNCLIFFFKKLCFHF